MFQGIFVADENPAIWAPVKDLIVATPGMFAVAQNSPTALGIPDEKWAAKVSTAWDYQASSNDVEAGEGLANRINALTTAGRTVLVDEIHGGGDDYDPLPQISIAIDLLTHPSMVYWYIAAGRYVSYMDLDGDDEFPVITRALERGCGLLPEIYIPQATAERSSNIPNFIDLWYRGPGDGRMPYLLALHNELQSTSPIHFIYPTYDRFYKRRNAKLKRLRFLDLVMQRAALRYPTVFRSGVGTYIWHSGRMKDPNRAADFAAIWNHYYAGLGLSTNGRVRYYAAERRVVA